jgi:hypothetical protein
MAVQSFGLIQSDGALTRVAPDGTTAPVPLPAGVTVDYDNLSYFQRFAAPGFTLEYLIFVTNQTGGQKVSVFGFGHKK